MIQRLDFAPLDGITRSVFRRVWFRHFGGADRIDLTEDTSPNFLGGAMRVHDFMAASLDELRQYSEEPQLGGM